MCPASTKDVIQIVSTKRVAECTYTCTCARIRAHVHFYVHAFRCNDCGSNTFAMLGPVAQTLSGRSFNQCKDKALPAGIK